MLFEEIEQVFLRQVEHLLALRSVALGLGRITALGDLRQGPPEVAIGLLLIFQPLARPFAHLFRGEAWRAAVAEDALVHQRMGGIENGFDGGSAVPLLAFGHVFLGEIHIAQDRAGICPLAKEIVVLEEVVMAESGMRGHQRLHRHGVFFHEIGDAGIGIDHQLIGKTAVALTVVMLLIGKALAEGPVLVHERHADRGIGVEHLFGGDDLQLVRVDAEAHFFERDLLDRVVSTRQRRKIPVGPLEQET